LSAPFSELMSTIPFFCLGTKMTTCAFIKCLGRPSLIAAAFFAALGYAALPRVAAEQKKPNILVIWGDDIGYSNISAYNLGMMGYKTPNIDRLAKEGALFTDFYAQQSCTAGRASFILGQHPFRTGYKFCHF
jgi:Sulfatase